MAETLFGKLPGEKSSGEPTKQRKQDEQPSEEPAAQRKQPEKNKKEYKWRTPVVESDENRQVKEFIELLDRDDVEDSAEGVVALVRHMKEAGIGVLPGGLLSDALSKLNGNDKGMLDRLQPLEEEMFLELPPAEFTARQVERCINILSNDSVTDIDTWIQKMRQTGIREIPFNRLKDALAQLAETGNDKGMFNQLDEVQEIMREENKAEIAEAQKSAKLAAHAHEDAVKLAATTSKISQFPPTKKEIPQPAAQPAPAKPGLFGSIWNRAKSATKSAMGYIADRMTPSHTIASEPKTENNVAQIKKLTPTEKPAQPAADDFKIIIDDTPVAPPPTKTIEPTKYKPTLIEQNITKPTVKAEVKAEVNEKERANTIGAAAQTEASRIIPIDEYRKKIQKKISFTERATRFAEALTLAGVITASAMGAKLGVDRMDNADQPPTQPNKTAMLDKIIDDLDGLNESLAKPISTNRLTADQQAWLDNVANSLPKEEDIDEEPVIITAKPIAEKPIALAGDFGPVLPPKEKEETPPTDKTNKKAATPPTPPAPSPEKTKQLERKQQRKEKKANSRLAKRLTVEDAKNKKLALEQIQAAANRSKNSSKNPPSTEDIMNTINAANLQRELLAEKAVENQTKKLAALNRINISNNTDEDEQSPEE